MLQLLSLTIQVTNLGSLRWLVVTVPLQIFKKWPKTGNALDLALLFHGYNLHL